MRVAPQGLRSVIIDGVAPSWVNLYNALALKNDEAVQHLVDQCAADKACNDAYPDLGRIFNETLDRAAKGDIVFQGQKVPVEVVAAPIITRNGKYNSAPITRFIPAYIYELWRGKEMPTVELLTAAKFDTPRADDAAVLKAAGALDAGQQGLIQQILDNTAIAARAEKGSARAVAALRDANESTRAFGPLVHLFDQELSGALREVIRADRSKARNVLADYTAMQNARPGKDVLQGFVEKHTDGAARARLSNLIAGMSEKELQGSFTVIRRDSLKTFTPFFYEFFLDVYACQEDIPFSSLEGYRAAAARLRYPQIGPLSDPLAKGFFEACAQFKPQPRDNWHIPVQSAIPTLSFGSLFDIQTPASWAKAATEKLSNAQVFMIPEAGHGALPLSINSHGYVADTSQRAADEAFGPFKAMMDRIGRERGWAPMSRSAFDASTDLHGANLVGSPQQVIEKILFQHEIFGHDRFLIQFSVGTMPHDRMMRSIELFGTVVAPAVREALSTSAVA